MKKIVAILMIIVSASVFGQDAEKEIFDLSDDVLTENEKNFLDFYNNHWPKERESTKKMLVEMMSLFERVKTTDSFVEEFLSGFSNIVYGDEFSAMAELWQEGIIPNFSAMAAYCNVCLIASNDLSDKTIVIGYKILKKYCEEEQKLPVTLITSLYREIYK